MADHRLSLRRLTAGLLRSTTLALLAGIALTYAVSAAIVIASPDPDQSTTLRNLDERDSLRRYEWYVNREKGRSMLRWTTRCNGPWTVRSSPLIFQEPLKTSEIPTWLTDALVRREHELDQRISLLPASADGTSPQHDLSNWYAYSYHDEFVGWPHIALRCSTRTEDLESGTPRRHVRWGVPSLRAVTKAPPHPISAVPLMPVWPGFAINTAIYASGAWLLLTIPGVLRRALRRRAGRCTRCAYDRRGLAPDAPCPECGTSAPAQRRRPPLELPS